jgi:ubiquinone biosynthesis protein
VVVKVQRPNIETVIETDLEILFDLARLLYARTPLGKVYDLPEIAEDFSYSLRAEMDYRREGRNADRFRRNFENERFLHIPQVYWELTTRRVIIFERISGIKINNVGALDRAGLDRPLIARHCARLIVKEVLEDGFFHADPHPGNFLVMTGEGGEPLIGAMDFGLVGHLAPRVKDDLVRLFIVATRLDAESIVDQLVRMSAAGRHVDRRGLERDLERLLNRYHGRPLSEIRAREVVEEVMPIAFRHQLRLPSDLWLLGKTLAMMEGVGVTLDPDLDMFKVAEPYARRFVRGMISPRVWGRRMLDGAEGWSDMMLRLPVQLPRLLDLVTEGDLDLGMRIRGQDVILQHLDRLGNRLAISILVAALIIGLALVVFAGDGGGWLAPAGFAAVVFLGLWLVISILRSGRR